MESEVNSRALEAIDCDNLALEDCQYILRSLEKRAFEHVVCALRAQGPLTEYKEIILDHLKALFFISDNDYLMRLRLCANDAVLSKIAERLNPSYDCSSEWLASGYDVMLLDLPKTVQLNTGAPNRDSRSMAEQMREQMAQHNSRLDEECQATLKLLRLTKRPFVPEKLRRLLQDSENDVNGRVDVAKDRGLKSSSGKSSHRAVGRPPRRFENAVDRPSVSRSTDSTATKIKLSSKLSPKKSMEKTASVVDGQMQSSTAEVGNGTGTSAANVEAAVDSVPPTSFKGAGTTSKSAGRSSKHANKSTAGKEESPAGVGIVAETVTDAPVACQPGPSNAALLAVGPLEDAAPNNKLSPIAANGAGVAQKTVVKVEDIENQNAAAVGEFSIHYSGGANVVVVDPEDQSTTKEPKMRKRRTKVIDDVTCTCARVHPFIFEPAIGDMPKPPRGNPDKRCSKLKASKRAQNNNDFNLFNYVPQQPQMAGTYYPQKSVSYYNSASALEIHPLKRSRTTSIPDDSNLMYQKPHSRVIGTPLNMMTTPTYSGATPRSSYYGGGQQTPIVVGGAPAAPSYASSLSDYGAVNDRYYSSGAPPTRSTSSSVVVGGADPMDHYHHPHHRGDADMVIAGYAPARTDIMSEECYSGVEQIVYTKDHRPAHLVAANPLPVKQNYRRYAPREAVDSLSAQQPPQHPQPTDSGPPTVGSVQPVLLRPAGNSGTAPSETKAAASSGLEFLASTASLLVPMQTTESQLLEPPQRANYYVGIPEPSTTQQQHHHTGQVFAVSAGSATSQAPQQIIYVQNPAPSSSSGVMDAPAQSSATVAITYYSTGTAPPPTSSVLAATNDAVNAVILQQQPPSGWMPEKQGNAFIPTTTTVAAVGGPSDSAESSGYQAVPQPPSTAVTTPLTTQTRFADDEATQNFLKQSLIDTNGLPLNEELTLGSIIRSSNLRNKLFSTATAAAAVNKSSASPSPSANSPSFSTTVFTSPPSSQLATTTFSMSAPPCGGGENSYSAGNEACRSLAPNCSLALTAPGGAESLPLSAVNVITTTVAAAIVDNSPTIANRPN